MDRRGQVLRTQGVAAQQSGDSRLTGAPGDGRASEAETRLSCGSAATGREQVLGQRCGAQPGVRLAASVILRKKR